MTTAYQAGLILLAAALLFVSLSITGWCSVQKPRYLESIRQASVTLECRIPRWR